ncbi:hypothetical protein FB45DRAFT_980007 [Roridomyces roridus]|uniref:Malate dehydrogenase n=1 Tax=Roridomyces roridus TaxID=1738132 RepID=A0AAD7FHG4_9AGAR|nr:hypothetical protein FB45DRAFT_980007 [Roridomyces roridus]
MHSSLLALALASATLSAIAAPSNLLFPGIDLCKASKAVMDLPKGQTALVSPPSGPRFVALGVGVQNYTCTGSTYTSIGAVASLFDISCLDETLLFPLVQTLAFDIWKISSPEIKASSIGPLVAAPNLLGSHYFVPSPSGSGISPKWDFTPSIANPDPDTFVIAAKVGDIAAPHNPATNVDWLSLNHVEGNLASQIFRIDTVGGQPPSHCVAGSAPISVKYAAKYFLYSN